MPFFVYRLAGTSSAKAATDWGRKAPSAAFCTHAQAGQCHGGDLLGLHALGALRLLKDG